MSATLNDKNHKIPVGGVWKRLWEEDPLGDKAGADVDTLVLWTQAPNSGIYVDIRLPIGSPGRFDTTTTTAFTIKRRPEALEGTALSIAETADDEEFKALLPMLARHKSFAGVLQYSVGDTTSGEALGNDKVLAELAATENGSLCTCFWRRDIDYQPPSGGLDVGVCATAIAASSEDGSMEIRETGDDASYAEGWHRLAGSHQGPFFALELQSENGNSQRKGYWVRAGKYFAYAVGRPADSETAQALGCHPMSGKVNDAACSSGKSLQEAVTFIASEAKTDRSNNDRVLSQLMGSYVAVAGEIMDGGTWTIKYSTDPGLVDCLLVDATMGPLSCSTLNLEDSGNGKAGTTSSANLVEGSVLSQTIAGTGKKTRIWKVVEISGASGLPVQMSS